MNVARYVDKYALDSGLTNREIAAALGIRSANFISMIRTGATKLPIKYAARLARIIRADPPTLVFLCLREYRPEEFAALRPFLKPA